MDGKQLYYSSLSPSLLQTIHYQYLSVDQVCGHSEALGITMSTALDCPYIPTISYVKCNTDRRACRSCEYDICLNIGPVGCRE
jgi:hypothetical protein